MQRTVTRIPGGLLVLFLGLESCAEEKWLVLEGRAYSTIVISPSASADEKLAAAELQDYIRKMSGATLPVAASAGPRDSSVVRIGVFGSEAVGDWRGQAPPPDGFALERRGDTLFIVGGDPRGALYGVYDLLENELGVRWFMPGEMGEDVPSRETIPLPSVRRNGAPAFEAVGGLIWAGGPGATAWERRARAKIGPSNAFFGHNWSNIIPPTPANRTANPEWFALNNGVRTNQLCSAHRDVVRISIEKAQAFFAARPDALVFSLSPNDGYGFCEDWRCQAVDRLYPGGSLSDRLVHYANEVLAELEKSHPDKQVGILAYVDHTPPPTVARPHPNYATLITHMPWEFCQAHPIDDPNCIPNRGFLAYLQGWRQVCRHVGVYDYYGHFYIFAPWPIVHSIRRDLPLFHRLGVDRFMSETQQHWANQGLNFYVAAKLAWDPSTDVDRLLTDYYGRFYGKAAEPMRRYWERWERAMIETASPEDRGYAWLKMFTPELVGECGQYLSEAERLAGDDREKVRRRVAFARMGFRFTEAWVRMRDHAARRAWAAAIAAGEEAIQRIQETAGTEPQAFYIPLAVPQTRNMMQPYRDALAAGN